MTRRDDPGRQTREALERALVGADTSVRRLVESVPALLAEAERARRQAGRTEVASVARAWIPRLALAAGALVVAAWLAPARPTAEADDRAVLDGWIVTGRAASPVADPVMDAVVRQEGRP